MAEQPSPADAPPTDAGSIEYGRFYFQHDCGLPYERNERWLGFFGEIADGIVRHLHPTSALDAGCAMGFLVEALRKRGVDAWGVDISEYAISQVHESVRDRCRVASLTEPLTRTYDLITCIEVLEHIEPAEVDKVIANLCAATDRLLLSTSPDDFGEATHLNVQPPEVWAAALAREGFFRDLDQDVSFLTPWAAVYVRREQATVETVRGYERSLWRAKQETAGARTTLLAAQKRLAEIEQQEVEDRESRPELQAELDRRGEEILRLRDLAIGKDAELGAVKGQLASLEEQVQRLLNAAGRIQARVPRLSRLVRAVLRRLRRI